jgi:hypothetical protein
MENESRVWIEDESIDEENVQQLLTVDRELCFKNSMEDDLTNSFLSNPHTSSQPNSQFLNYVMDTIE